MASLKVPQIVKKSVHRSLPGSERLASRNSPLGMQSSSSRAAPAVAGQELGSHLAGGYDVDWRLLAAKLPTGKDKESRAARERLWRKADANGNGFLSLAEIDKALHDSWWKGPSALVRIPPHAPAWWLQGLEPLLHTLRSTAWKLAVASRGRLSVGSR